MRWSDERYVRVYTRDTGDWLALSFQAQALFLMLLRKVDRIGELHLGKRGRAAIGACVGHPGTDLTAALDELLSDGCIRLADDGTKLLVPNFLQAQEAAKSPAERKREQRERDAAEALEKTQLSRDVTPVTSGHEMSPRAVPCRAEPSVPSEPETTLSASPPVVAPTDPIRAGYSTPLANIEAHADRRQSSPEEKQPQLELVPGEGLKRRLQDQAEAVFAHWRHVMGKRGTVVFDGKRRRAVEARLREGSSVEELCEAVDGCALTPHNMGENDRGERYDDLELICRDAGRVDRFRRHAQSPPQRAASKGRATNADKDWTQPVRTDERGNVVL